MYGLFALLAMGLTTLNSGVSFLFAKDQSKAYHKAREARQVA